MRIVFGIVALLSASAAQASNWQRVTNDTDDQPIYVDADSLHLAGGKMVFWDKLVMNDGNVELVNEAIDCRLNTWTLLELQHRLASGRLTDSTSPTVAARAIPPDSVVEQVRNFVCR